MEFRKNKKFTEEERLEIINYAKENGIWSVKAKFNVWPETVRYWINPDLREKVKATKRKKDVERDKAYRLHRKTSGISRETHLQWHSNLLPEEKLRQKNIAKQHRLDNIEHYKQKARERYLKDKESGKHREKYNTDPVHKLRCNIREHVRQAVKYSNVSKTHPSIIYLGCTIDEFRSYIESQFREGMSWDNHSRGEDCWHLDHIKPLAMLKYISDLEALKEICHYTNYQPLWEKENLQKQDKYEG